MANRRGRERGERHDGDGEIGSSSAARGVERLRRSFAEFRRENRSRARIPETLREAVLAAVARGMPEHDVLRACRISRIQLDRWRECQGASSQRRESFVTEPRIFPVVEEDPVLETTDGGEEEELHLRVGRWAISIRPVVS